MEMNIKYYKYIPLDEIKKEIHMTSDGIQSKFTYPNGFVLEMTQTAEGVTVNPSGVLIDNQDGTYTIPEQFYPNPS